MHAHLWPGEGGRGLTVGLIPVGPLASLCSASARPLMRLSPSRPAWNRSWPGCGHSWQRPQRRRQ